MIWLGGKWIWISSLDFSKGFKFGWRNWEISRVGEKRK
jgi:hypothetical protein